MIAVANHNIRSQLLHRNSTSVNSQKFPPLRQTHWMCDGQTGTCATGKSLTKKAHKIGRADLAAFMVQQLESSRYVRQAVTVTTT